MSEQELFDIIDEGIDIFKKNEGYQKRMKVSSKPDSDWLVFNWRQLAWENNGLSYIIEVYPNFDKKENIISWTLYSAVWHDLNGQRFYLKKVVADGTTLDFIANNIVELLTSGYQSIVNVTKEEIPFAVDLKK